MVVTDLGKPGIDEQPPSPGIWETRAAAQETQKCSGDKRRGAFQTSMLNVWNSGAKKNVAKCDAANRKAFLDPECGSHRTMKGKQQPCRSLLSSAILLQPFQEAKEMTIQPVSSARTPHPLLNLQVPWGRAGVWPAP